MMAESHSRAYVCVCVDSILRVHHLSVYTRAIVGERGWS